MVCNRRPHQQGFTLLEMMVTVLIIGIMLGTATTFLRFSPQQQLSRETERLWQLFNLAHEESRSRGHIYGWQLSESHYQFMIFNAQDNRWLPVVDTPLQNRPIDDKLTIQIDFPSLPSKPDSTQTALTGTAEKTADIPQIVFYPNGESTPFHLVINQRDEPLAKENLSWLDSEGIGRIFLSTPDSRQHD